MKYIYDELKDLIIGHLGKSLPNETRLNGVKMAGPELFVIRGLSNNT